MHHPHRGSHRPRVPPHVVRLHSGAESASDSPHRASRTLAGRPALGPGALRLSARLSPLLPSPPLPSPPLPGPGASPKCRPRGSLQCQLSWRPCGGDREEAAAPPRVSAHVFDELAGRCGRGPWLWPTLVPGPRAGGGCTETGAFPSGLSVLSQLASLPKFGLFVYFLT